MGLGTFLSVTVSICLIVIFGTALGVLINIVKFSTGSMDILPGIFPDTVGQIVVRIWSYIFMFAVLVFGLTSMFLIMIFILWMIIKHIVPSWILFIPVRKILLKVPPFPELTKAGILPLMERIINVFGGSGTLFKKLGISSQAVLAFLFKATKYVFKKITPDYNPEKISSKTNEISGGKIDMDTDPSDKPEYESKPPDDIEDDSDSNAFYRKTIIMIDNEKINCSRSKRKEIKPYFSSSELAATHIFNTAAATKCEAESIVGYMKASFTRDI